MSSNSDPPRRFKPELIEEKSTSSKDRRRFQPEPVSTTSKSSRQPPTDDLKPTAIQFEDDQPSSSKPVEPVADQNPPKETPKPRRKFAPQPVENSTRSSRKQADKRGDSDEAPLLPHETTAAPAESPTEKRPRRKFAPELIETAKRSRKSGDTIPAVLPADKTNASPGDAPRKAERPTPLPIAPANSPAVSQLEVPVLKPAPMRQGSMKPHNNTRTNTRQHSFKVPSLPDIDSSESDGSRIPSLSPSRGENSDTSDEAYKDKTRMRESADEDVSGYLLALAARAADKQLREQEAAAFANTDYHEPVTHYMNRSDSDDDGLHPNMGPSLRIDKSRRDSGDEKAELQRMKKHGERVYEQKQSMEKEPRAEIDERLQPAGQDVWAGKSAGVTHPGPDQVPKNVIGGYQKCPDLKQMRKAASPPMLGGDIDFPRCASPDHARFDVTQGADYLRKNMCYLSEQTEMQTGLWGLGEQKRPTDKPRDRTQNEKSRQGTGAGGGGKGLWGGFCKGGGNQSEAPTPTGLVTPMRTPLASPAPEREDPFASLFSKAANASISSRPRTPIQAPPTPPLSTSPRKDQRSQHLLAPSIMVVDARLQIEARLDAEFDDAFVSQVYNYLSFGYPALARKFDDELSRVSKVSVPELREDDTVAQARGYVRLGDDEIDGGARGLEETTCKRWRALRRYCREWGRQMMQKESEEGGGGWGVAGQDPLRAWGLPARRGSWGI